MKVSTIDRDWRVSRALLAQAIARQCVCGNQKLVDPEHPRPFCYACVQELLTRQLRTLYTTAYHELQALAGQDPAQIGFLFAYDLCCDAIAAIRRGAWPANLRAKKSLEDA